jgi:hypothetical protein
MVTLAALKTTHTFAVMAISPAAYDEIAAILRGAGYGHAFLDGGLIDMHGIAVEKMTPEQVAEAAGDAAAGG